MATINVNPLDKISQEHAMYILRALQTVKTQVVFNAGEIAFEKNMKVNSVVKQFSIIRKRYNLNIATTAVGYPGGRASDQKSKVASSTIINKRAIEGHDTNETETDHAETPAKARKSSSTPKPVKREYEYDFNCNYGDSEDEDGESKPSPAKKRIVKSGWTSGEEFGKQDGHATDGTEQFWLGANA